MSNPKLKTILPVFIFFILMFLVWFGIGAVGFYKAVISFSWPTVQGRVISSQVIRSSGKSTKYIAEVVYIYQAGENEYQSNKLKATSARGTSEWAKAVVKSYPPETVVTVHYNPDKPGDSVIEPGLQSDNYFMTLIPLSAIAILVLALIKQIKRNN